jgi:hypothetical protein
MAGVGASMGRPWELAGEGRGRGRGEGGGRCGVPWGGRGVMGRGAALASCGLPVAATRSLVVVRAAVHEGEEEKDEREKKRKGRKRIEKKKKKIRKIFQT